MILLDTHIWVWWADNSAQLRAHHKREILNHASTGIGVSAFSMWEVAMLEAKGRLTLSQPLGVWLRQALALPGVRLMPLTPEVAVESANLPGDFHRDPADQIIVATARIEGALLLTEDAKILAYAHVQTA